MPFTRAQATELLNKTEMKLYDDSRANVLRRLDRAALAGRIARTRAARDRARDLLKRQRAAARKRGEDPGKGMAARTARKEALLVELLERFVVTRRTAPEKAVKKAVAKKGAAKTTAATKATAKKAVPGKSRTKKAAANTPRRAARKLSPERALENTRRLLEAKHERDRSPQPWQSLDPGVGHVPQSGYQSVQAAGQALELHAGESSMASIHGSHSSRDRYNQGKRDNRGDND